MAPSKSFLPCATHNKPPSPNDVPPVIKGVQIGFFENIQKPKGKNGALNVSLHTALEDIKSGRWEDKIKRLRTLELGSAEHKKSKSELPAFMFCGTTKNGGHAAADVGEHSGLLPIDFDHVAYPASPTFKTDVTTLRDLLGKDQHVLAAWISPSGDGVKALVQVPPDLERHKDSFAAVMAYMLGTYPTYAQKFDPVCSDLGRVCFVSHDPGLVMNPVAVELPVAVKVEVPRVATTPPQPMLVGAEIRKERARAHLATMAPAVSGQFGHTVTLKAAIVLIRGYCLSEDEAYPLLAEWNKRCDPPWSEGDLRRKLSEAATKSNIPYGYLLNERQSAELSPLPLIRSIQELCDTPPDPTANLLGERLLCRGGAMLIVGPSGVGKSSMSMQQDICWAVGRAAFGIIPVRPLRILTIQAENDDGDLYEMSWGVIGGIRLTEEERIMAAVNLHYVTEVARSGEPFLDMLDRLLTEHPCDIVRIDPLFAFYGAKIEDSEKLSLFLRGGINPILHMHDVGLILAHHTPKTNNRDTSNWTHTDYSYAGAGGAELTNWARAMLVLEATHTQGTFKLIAAKRGPRTGWRDPSGVREFIRYYRHSRHEGVICWEEGDPNEVANDAMKKKTSARKPASVDPEPLIEELVPHSRPIERKELESAVCKRGASQKRTTATLNRMIDADEPKLFVHREKRKPGRDRILIARYRQSKEIA